MVIINRFQLNCNHFINFTLIKQFILICLISFQFIIHLINQNFPGPFIIRLLVKFEMLIALKLNYFILNYFY